VCSSDLIFLSTPERDETVISNTCSSSQSPRFNSEEEETERYLIDCPKEEGKYVASSTYEIPGSDDNDCSDASPCFSLFNVINIYINSNKLPIYIYILECDYYASPVGIPDEYPVYISSRSDPTITTISYDPASEPSDGLFIVIDGYVSIALITIIHTSESKGPIFMVEGEGFVSLRSLTVIGTDSLDEACSFSFAVLNNGGSYHSFYVSYRNLTFVDGSIVKSTGSSDILFVGESEILNIHSQVGNGVLFNCLSESTDLKFIISDANIANISTGGSTLGGLISIAGLALPLTIGDKLNITDVSTNDVSTHGGVIYIGKSTSTVTIVGVTFTNIVSQIGGILYVDSCHNIYITKTVVTESVARNGPGGAIFFGDDTGFKIDDSKFNRCRSINGLGGCIASNSSYMEGDRIINNCSFNENVGGEENKGNDYADINPNFEVLSIYNTTTISLIDSNSSLIKFYFQMLDVSLDCIFDDFLNYCRTDAIYVSGKDGLDSYSCGISEDVKACEHVEFTIQSRIKENGTIYVMSGVYSVGVHNFRDWNNFTFKIEGYDNNNDYPVLHPVITSILDVYSWFSLYKYADQKLIFEKLKIVYPYNNKPSIIIYPIYLFTTRLEQHAIYFEDCYFTMDEMNNVVELTNPLFVCVKGV
jgi:hypothetical protein